MAVRKQPLLNSDIILWLDLRAPGGFRQLRGETRDHLCGRLHFWTTAMRQILHLRGIYRVDGLISLLHFNKQKSQIFQRMTSVGQTLNSTL